MRKQLALVLLTIVSCLVWMSMFVEAWWSKWIAVPLVCGFPVLLVLVALGERCRLGKGLFVLWLMLTGSWLGLLWLSSTHDLVAPGEAEVVATLTLMLLGLGLAPMALVAWLHARSFLLDGLAPEDLDRLRGRPGP